MQAAIDQFNAMGHPGRTTPMPSAEDSFKDWAVAIWLDAEINGTKFDFANINFGDPITSGYTIEIANELFFGGRGVYNGSMPPARWAHNKNVPGQTALPFGVSYESFRNPGPTFKFLMDGEDSTQIVPHSEPMRGTRATRACSTASSTLTALPSPAARRSTSGPGTSSKRAGTSAIVEALVGAEWAPLDVTDERPARSSPPIDDPFGNNTEGNGITGHLGRRVLRRRAGIRQPDGHPAGRRDRRPVPLLDRCRLPRHRLVR